MEKSSHTYRLKAGIHEKLNEIALEHQRNLHEYMKTVNLDNAKLEVKISPSNVLQGLIEEEYRRLFKEEKKS